MSTSTEPTHETVQNAIAYLRSPQAIRDRCNQLFELAIQDQLQHFRCHLDQIDRVAEYVIQVTRANYPDLKVPFHSRWRHFEVGQDGGVARLTRFSQVLSDLSPLEQAKAKFDLAMISVLLDAGAGSTWQYVEPETGERFKRSEGLAVASFNLFCQGGFSSSGQIQADAEGLQALTEADLATGFQVTADNPMVGLQGRLSLLQQLGTVLPRSPHLFGTGTPRPGNLVQYLLEQAPSGQLSATRVLDAVLEGLSDIWPGRVAIAHVNLGDVWPHSALRESGIGANLIPFHKLSQWLTYSLLEPLQDLGLKIVDLNALTGLPEYRNGGLCLDLGVLQAKYDELLTIPHDPGSEVIVEWRALTVVLLDRIAARVRQRLSLTEEDLPLVTVLQGGTWTAGRQIAATLREGGVPPIQLKSDGTVF